MDLVTSHFEASPPCDALSVQEHCDSGVTQQGKTFELRNKGLRMRGEGPVVLAKTRNERWKQRREEKEEEGEDGAGGTVLQRIFYVLQAAKC
mmetsp:Transcript_20528/g.33795  ORF Transcript_20528/g.33795 Transcript_20528/m.33795 type:complete len:92 (-) Transcript_20528:3794-4069(-)